MPHGSEGECHACAIGVLWREKEENRRETLTTVRRISGLVNPPLLRAMCTKESPRRIREDATANEAQTPLTSFCCGFAVQHAEQQVVRQIHDIVDLGL